MVLDDARKLVLDNWASLWDSNAVSALAERLRTGFAGVSPPLDGEGQIALEPVGPVILCRDEEHEFLSWCGRKPALSGLDHVQDGGVDCEEGGGFRARIDFGGAVLELEHELLAGSGPGSAVYSARGLMNMFGENTATTPIEEGGTTVDPDDDYIHTARSYRAQLQAKENNKFHAGTTLVDTYYANNAALAEICTEHNPFTTAWPTKATTSSSGKFVITSAGAAHLTLLSAKNPTDDGQKIGDDAYLKHSAVMHFILTLTVCEKIHQLGGKPPKLCQNADSRAEVAERIRRIPRRSFLTGVSAQTKVQRYVQLAEHIDAFNKTVLQHTPQAPMTVGDVMNLVATSDPQALADAIEHGEPVTDSRFDEAREDAQAFFDEWMSEHGDDFGRSLEEVSRKSLLVRTRVTPVGLSMELNGSVAQRSGRSWIDIESVEASVGRVLLDFPGPVDPLVDRTRVAMATMPFLERVMRSRIAWAMESDRWSEFVGRCLNVHLTPESSRPGDCDESEGSEP